MRNKAQTSHDLIHWRETLKSFLKKRGKKRANKIPTTAPAPREQVCLAKPSMRPPQLDTGLLFKRTFTELRPAEGCQEEIGKVKNGQNTKIINGKSMSALRRGLEGEI